MEKIYDAMAFTAPVTQRMNGVFRSGVLLGLHNTEAEAKQHMNASVSLRQQETYGWQMRVVPLTVTYDLYQPEKGDLTHA